MVAVSTVKRKGKLLWKVTKLLFQFHHLHPCKLKNRARKSIDLILQLRPKITSILLKISQILIETQKTLQICFKTMNLAHIARIIQLQSSFKNLTMFLAARNRGIITQIPLIRIGDQFIRIKVLCQAKLK